MTQMNSLIKFSTRAPGYGRIQNGTTVNKMKEYMETAGAVGTCCGNARKKGRDPRETKHVVMLGQPASVSIQI